MLSRVALDHRPFMDRCSIGSPDPYGAAPVDAAPSCVRLGRDPVTSATAALDLRDKVHLVLLREKHKPEREVALN